MKEMLMVRGERHWVADKEGKVLLGYYDSYEDARMAIREMERRDKEDGIYVWSFYTVVKCVLGALKLKGYTAIDDIHLCADVL